MHAHQKLGTLPLATPAVGGAASNENDNAPELATVAGPQVARLRRFATTWAPPILAAIVLATIAILLFDVLVHIDLKAVATAAAATPRSTFLLSLVLAGVSYLALIGYDACALRSATAKQVPFGTVALGSFTSYAIGHALGFPLVTAGAVRWRVYGRAGLTLAEVAKLTAVAGLTLWLGIAAALGAGAVFQPKAMAAMDHLPAIANKAIGLVLLAGLAAFAGWSASGERSIGRGDARVKLPGAGSVSVQILLGLVDVGAAAAALWVLIPTDVSIGFPAFAAVFAVAILLAIVSHAPAGLGAFEAAMLLALPDVPAETLLSALLVWRVTYTLIPFALSAVLFAGHEVLLPQTRLSRIVDRARLLTQPLVPPTLGALTFLGGLVLLVSGAVPSDDSRMRALRHLLPLPFSEVSHLVGSAAGVALLVLAHGLIRRLGSARVGTSLVLTAGIVVSLAKGFDWEEALVLGIVLGLLLAYRSAFHRKAGLFAEPLSPAWLVAIIVVIGCSIWLGFIAYSNVDYSSQLWWNFNWHDDASRFLRASLAAVVVGAGLSLHALVHRRPSPRRAEPIRADLLAPALAQSARADAHLALLGDKLFMAHEEGDAFLMYRVQGKSWVVMGDPVGPLDRARELMWRFLDEVDRHGGWPVFYQVSPALLPMYLDAGLSLVKLGEEAKVDLSTFTTEGRAGRDWRNALNRAKRDGLEFAVVPSAEVPALLPELRSVSDAWLANRNAGEKGFSIGYWSEDYLSRFDIAVIRKAGEVIAFANLWYGQPGGEITIDLMRYLPGATGVMDLLFVNLMQEGKARGYRWFNLGMAPLSGLSAHRLAPHWHKIAAFVARNGEQFYGFAGLRAYKEKFDPVWEPRYLASPGGWALPQVLLDVTTLVSNNAAKSVRSQVGAKVRFS